MHAAVLVFHVLIALFLIGLILVQHGKGADAGAAFGSGASSTVFGARGSASFLSKTTAILALCFFSTSFWLDYLSASTVEKPSLIQNAADTGSTDVVETTIEPIEDDKPATDGAGDTDLPDVPGAKGDEDRPDTGPDPKSADMPETAKGAEEPATDKSTSKRGEDRPAAPPNDKKTAPPDPEPAADPAPEKPSGPDAARPSVNAPVKGEVKPAPEPGAAPLENSATPADKPAEKAAAKKIPAEKSR